jgi:hypothetical protein
MIIIMQRKVAFLREPRPSFIQRQAVPAALSAARAPHWGSGMPALFFKNAAALLRAVVRIFTFELSSWVPGLAGPSCLRLATVAVAPRGP